MAIINQTSFISGELSPKVQSQTNTDQYKTGLETATNCLITEYGAIDRRNGTTFVAAAHDSSAKSRLIPYTLDADNQFILEFANQTIRVFSTSGQITESDKTITGITQANPGVITSTAHGYSNGDRVYITSVVGMTEINDTNLHYIVANVTANTFTLTDIEGNAINTTGYTAYSSGGTANKVYEITSPYTTAQLDDVNYYQDGTTLYLVHPSVAPRTLVRNGSTDWSLTTIDFEIPATVEAGKAGSQTLTLSASTGTGVTATAGAAFWEESDVGRQIVSLVDNGIATITAYTSTTVVTVDISTDFGTTSYTASSEWKVNLSPVSAIDFTSGVPGEVATVRGSILNDPTLDTGTVLVFDGNDGTGLYGAAHGLIANDLVYIEGMEDAFTKGGAPDGTYEVGVVPDSNHITIQETHTATAVSSASWTQVAGGSGTISFFVTETTRLTPQDTFLTADVGKYIYANGGVYKIISRTSSSVVKALCLKAPTTTSYTATWSLEEELWNSTDGYPETVIVHQDRLWFGATSAYPLRLWGSDTGNYLSFDTSATTDSNGIDIEISSEQGGIQWIEKTRELIVGTLGQEFTVNGGTVNAAITASNISATPRTNYGSKSQKALALGNTVLFIENARRKIRSMSYDFNIDTYRAADLTILAEHLTEDRISELTYAKSPDTLLYALTDTGGLLVANYEPNKNIIAFSTYTTDGTPERILGVNTTTDDILYVMVKRTINGNTRRYIEKITKATGLEDDHIFSDSALTYSTPLTITNITTANPAVVTSASHGLSNGDTVIIKDLVDPENLTASNTNMSSLNQGIYTVANKTTNTFELSGVDTSSGYNSYGSGGNAFKRVTALTGLDHLEGKTVQVKGDGAYQGTKTVSSGAITADTAAGEFVVGLPYTTTIKTLDLEYSFGEGSMQGQQHRWVRPLARVYRSTKPTMNSAILPQRVINDKTDQKIGLNTGLLDYGPLQWESTAALTFTVTDPMPLTLTGVTGAIDGGRK